MYSPAAVSYRVLAPFEVIQPFCDRPAFFTVPRGSVIETCEEIRSPGLCEISLDHRHYSHECGTSSSVPNCSMRRLDVVTVERFEELRASLDAAREEYQRVLEVHKNAIQFSGVRAPEICIGQIETWR